MFWFLYLFNLWYSNLYSTACPWFVQWLTHAIRSRLLNIHTKKQPTLEFPNPNPGINACDLTPYFMSWSSNYRLPDLSPLQIPAFMLSIDSVAEIWCPYNFIAPVSYHRQVSDDYLPQGCQKSNSGPESSWEPQEDIPCCRSSFWEYKCTIQPVALRRRLVERDCRTHATTSSLYRLQLISHKLNQRRLNDRNSQHVGQVALKHMKAGCSRSDAIVNGQLSYHL